MVSDGKKNKPCHLVIHIAGNSDAWIFCNDGLIKKTQHGFELKDTMMVRIKNWK